MVLLTDTLFCSVSGGIDHLFLFVYCPSSEGERS